MGKTGGEKAGPVGRCPQCKRDRDTGFAFGSYGRVAAATDGHGTTTQPMNVVGHGTRLEESPYVELDLYYRLKFKGVRVRTVTTLAFTEDLFHYTGDWNSRLAIRNLYLEAAGLFHESITFWAGSREYRGDDIYLLDWWPLDNLNTQGGGAMFKWKGVFGALHGGVNRLSDKFQYQKVPVPGLNNTSEDVVLLDRQRFVGSLKAGYYMGGQGSRIGMKFYGYAEVHMMDSGTYDAHLEPARREYLPSDNGWLLGAQVGLWNFGQRATHLNLFLRYAEGLAAYGEMAVPWGIARDRTARKARQLRVALAGNFEWRMLGVLVGGYLSYFRDADGNKYDWDDRWEGILALRPYVHLHRNFAQALEFSYQRIHPAGLEPWTATKQQPAVVKFSVIPMVVFGKGSYDRPQFRLVYTMAAFNKGARLMYNPLDPRFDRKIQHYLGIQAEWWFNSTYR